MGIFVRARQLLGDLQSPAGRWRRIRALPLKAPRVPRTIAIVYRSLWTAPGRERLRLSAYTRMAPAVRAAAAMHRRVGARKTRVVAVVGTFGKTTTTRAVRAALGLPVTRVPGRNSGAAVPAAVLGIGPHDRHAAIEVGVSGPGQMVRYTRLLQPDLVVVTCIGSEHLSSFHTLDATRDEKAEMVRALSASGVAILNGDDPRVLWMRGCTPARVVTYGFGDANDVRVRRRAAEGLEGTRLEIEVAGRSHTLRTRLIGRHMAYPILAAVAVAHAENLDLEPVLASLEKLEPTGNRLQPIAQASGAVLLLDAFKGGLETIHAALDALGEIPAQRRLLVLGDVEEPPGSQGPIYRDVGEHAAMVADYVFYVGGKTNLGRLRAGTTEGGFSREALVRVPAQPQAIAERLAAELRRGDVALIKGRLTQHLERVALLLAGVSVGCTRTLCRRRHDCETCPLLRGD